MSTSFIFLVVLLFQSQAEGLTRNHLREIGLFTGVRGIPDILCTKSELEFPSNFDAVVQLPTNVHTKGLVLPTNGALLLPKTAQLLIFPESKDLCGDKDDKFPQITQPKHLNWFDPRSWENGEQNQVKSIPHVERIPCSGDKVSMTVKSALSVGLDNVRSLSFGELNLDGREISADDLQSFMATELGQMMFKSTEGTRVRTGPTTNCECHAAEDSPEYAIHVCSHRTEACPLPKCFNPIAPQGFCCPVCGAVFRKYVNDCAYFDESDFTGHVTSLVTQMKLGDKISGYGSLIREGDKEIYQYVVLDAGDYNEDSVRFVKELQRTLPGAKHDVMFSGRFYTPGAGFSFWSIIFSTLLAVVAFFFVLYAYYEQDVLSSVALPPWLALNRYRIFHSPFVFARFENHPAADAEVPGNVLIGVGQDNEGFRSREAREPVATGTTTSFHNPMYSEKEIKSTASAPLGKAAAEAPESAPSTGSSSTNAGRDIHLVDDGKESALDGSGHHGRVEKVVDLGEDDEEEEQLVEVDLDSEVSSE